MHLISGTHNCSNCDKNLEWECFVRNRYVEVFQYTGKVRATLLCNPSSEQLQLRLHCDKCDEINFFTCHNSIYYKNQK